MNASVGSSYNIPAGAVIRVKRPVGVYHYGIVDRFVWLGQGQMVVHNTKGKGVEHTSLSEFAAGHPIELVSVPQYWSADTILRRAKGQIGQPYDLFAANCEHFVNWVVTGVKKSDQLSFGVTAAVLIGCLALVVIASSEA